MSLTPLGRIPLPGHGAAGRLDHAAVHRASSRLYLAHTSRDALDVIDCGADRFLRSIPDLRGVAGVLVSEERDLIFTSNRGENTVSIIPGAGDEARTKVAVGSCPNGLAFDPTRNVLLAANVGEPGGLGPHSVSLVDVRRRARTADREVPGRTRWALYDPDTDTFYVNIMDPPQIHAIDARDPSETWSIEVPGVGPHGLDLDRVGRRLFCACDDGTLFVVDLNSRSVSPVGRLGGKPDVVFFNENRDHLYVALKDPGAIDVFDTETMHRLGTTKTEAGAGTIAFDGTRSKVYAFLPETSQVAVFSDGEG